MRLSPAVIFRFVFAAVLLVTTGLLAQQAPAPDQSNTRPATSAPSSPSTADKPQNAPNNSPTANPITVQGCVNGGKQGYTLMQQGTGAAFQLESSTYLLKNTRGKVVQVTGRETSPKADSNNLPQLQVEALQIVSDHCVIPGKASGASTTVQQATRIRIRRRHPTPLLRNMVLQERPSRRRPHRETILRTGDAPAVHPARVPAIHRLRSSPHQNSEYPNAEDVAWIW